MLEDAHKLMEGRLKTEREARAEREKQWDEERASWKEERQAARASEATLKAEVCFPLKLILNEIC